MAERSRGSLDHGRVTHVVVKLPEMYISDFEKINPRTSRRGWIRGWWRHVEAKIGQSTAEEKPKKMLNQDKLPMAINKLFKPQKRREREGEGRGWK
jgi:hypothetical protein